MYTQQQVRFYLRRYKIVVLIMILGAITPAMLYMALMGAIRDDYVDFIGTRFGTTAAEIAPFLFVLLFFPIFLGPFFLVDKFGKRFALLCPVCNKDLSQAEPMLLVTKRCCGCESQLIEGKPHKTAAYRRAMRWRYYTIINYFSWTKYFLWLWPLAGMLVLAAAWTDTSPQHYASLSVIALLVLMAFVFHWPAVRTRCRILSTYVLLSILVFIALCFQILAFSFRSEIGF
jgi:hypothetical protein